MVHRISIVQVGGEQLLQIELSAPFPCLDLQPSFPRNHSSLVVRTKALREILPLQRSSLSNERDKVLAHQPSSFYTGRVLLASNRCVQCLKAAAYVLQTKPHLRQVQ